MSNKIVILATHPKTYAEWDYKKSLADGDDIYSMAHHDLTLSYATHAFESHSPEIVAKWGGEPHLKRLRKVANEMPLYTPWEWPETLGRFHYTVPHNELAHITEHFESSVAYMMAFAIDHLTPWHLTRPAIALYGVDMASTVTGGIGEYSYQRPNMLYLIGVARGRGITVELPPSCTLFDSQWKGGLYGSPRDVSSCPYDLKPTKQEYYE